ncbi:MAG: hypothetical protein COA79_15790 [Planctomycetota bacterium]|nr:MAG: hypothetical protein COA79_15790 [Planctomycetota bacterium]
MNQISIAIKSICIFLLIFNNFLIKLHSDENNISHLKWGKTTVIPKFLLNIISDDNVNLSESNKKSDVNILSNASIAIDSKLSFGLDVKLNALFIDSRNLDIDTEDFTGFQGSLDLNHELGKYNTILLNLKWMENREIISLDVNKKDVKTEKSYEVGHRFAATRLKFYSKMFISKIGYDALENQKLENELIGASSKASYQLNFISYSLNFSYVQEEYEFDLLQDNSNYQLDFGVSYEWSSLLKSELNLGWQVFEFKNSPEDEAEVPDTESPFGTLSIDYSGLEFFKISLSEEYKSQTGNTTPTNTSFSSNLSIEYNPTSKWKCLLNFGYIILKADGSADIEQKSIKTEVQYFGVRNIKFSGHIEYLDVTSGDSNGEYNRVLLGLSVEASW